MLNFQMLLNAPPQHLLPSQSDAGCYLCDVREEAVFQGVAPAGGDGEDVRYYLMVAQDVDVVRGLAAPPEPRRLCVAELPHNGPPPPD